MGARKLIFTGLAILLLLGAAAAYWRYVWFFRDPPRTPPIEAGILSPADGTIVYVRKVDAGEDVVTIKQGVPATLKDILREDLDLPKLVIGIFMSPFDVHYNRAPLGGKIGFIRHYPARGENLDMGSMHLRILMKREPYYENSMHIIQNERTVTYLQGEYLGSPLGMYVVQIGSRNVHGIESYFRPGDRIERGTTFGMIRIGSQVDLIVPWREDLRVQVQPGERVLAGETILVR
ncbi:MAG: phosphatidylserine decarboxylase [Chromatiaceae bacterium]|nr:phosphatidylserine decarboxylase [Chromatiaceae bacterium]